MEDRTYQRRKVSWHIHDLMKRDVQVVAEVHKWLEVNAEKPRDVANRTVSKRLLARKIAAEICLKAASGDVAACKEIMDRTEGKVADVVISGSFAELVAALEAGRQRLIAAKQPQDIVVEGEVVAPQDPQPEPIPTDSDTSK